MDVHILTPFYRKKLAKTLVYYWRQQNVFWYPLMAASDYVKFPNEDWVRPVTVKELKKGDNCFIKVDDFRNTQNIIDEDYYGVACDETTYEPGFMDILKQQTAKVVVCSSFRGDQDPSAPKAKTGASICIVKKVSELVRNNIGMGQYFVKGDILKTVPYAGEITEVVTDGKPVHKGGKREIIKLQRDDDGHYIVEMRKRYPNDIAILTDWFSFANYLEPGRFTTTKRFLKSTWELPKYIGIDIEKEKNTLHEDPKQL